jgi:LmbE family N-acetylglucosaminyl deacetylase
VIAVGDVNGIRQLTRLIKARLDQVLALRVERGPYRFLIRQFERIPDLQLIAGMLNTESFRLRLEPVPAPIEGWESMLVLAPHQDDEILGAGGALLRAKRAGARITVVFLTDGAQHDPAETPAGMAERRRQEALAVCERLGATAYFLGISNIELEVSVEQVEQLSSILRREAPEVILAPWPLDFPAKHRMGNHLLWLAGILGCPRPTEIWGYQVHNTILANSYVDISDVAEEKRSLITLYSSQTARRSYEHISMGLGAWNSRYLGSGRAQRYAELFFSVPAAEYLELIANFYFRDLEATYLGSRTLARSMRRIHDAVAGGGIHKRPDGRELLVAGAARRVNPSGGRG